MLIICWSRPFARELPLFRARDLCLLCIRCVWGWVVSIVNEVLKFARTALSSALFATVLAVPAVLAQPLPQLLPIGTVDKPFNDAAQDLARPFRFVLKDCGNSGPAFICTYGSTNGIGIVAWAAQPVGLVEELAIAIPNCAPLEDLADISTMLIHIFHPNRTTATYPRAIVAMARFADTSGSGEHWLDGVRYHLINRGPLGFGLVVRRTPASAIPTTASARARVAARQRFYLPDYACPGAAAVVSPVPAPVVVPPPVLRVYK